TYTPDETFAGVDLFAYTIDDNAGATSNAASVAVTVTGADGSQTLTFLPTDDGQVKITNASRNYGAKGTAKLELGKFRSYFKFDVSGLDGAIQSARLRLHVTTSSTDGSDQGGAAYLVSNDFKDSNTPWREDLLTSGNAPEIDGPALSTIGAVVPNEEVEFDVSAAISGNGVVSFALSTPSGNQVKYFTKEGAFPPTLIIETASGGAENQPPNAQTDQATTDEDTPVDISVTNNDSDSDGVLSLSSIQIATAPSNGSASVVQSSGVISYTPNQDFFGADSFAYTVRDDDGATSNVATVRVVVSGINDPPVAVDDAATLTNGTPIILTVTENDFDVDGTIDLTSIHIVEAPGKGSILVNPFSGLITYTPGAGFSGSDAFTYEVKDNNGATSNVATATIMEEGGGPPLNTFTFHPTDDGQVKLTEPGKNYGSKGTMKVKQGKFESYMKFDVSGLTGSVLSARLRLSVRDDGQNGGSLYLVGNTYSGSSASWDESGLTAGNAPQVASGVLQELGAVRLGDIIDLDVTAVIQGNGIYSFAVKGVSTDQTKFGTKEGLNPMPELVIEAGGDPPAAPLITSFNPTSGPANTVVTIVGQNLAGVDGVTFGGVAANFSVDSDAQITATVPTGAVSGRIEVTKAGIRATSADVFTLDAPATSGEMEIVLTTDDRYDLYVNGVLVGSNDQWNMAQTYVVPVRNGQNVLAVHGRNDGGDVGMIAEVSIDGEVVLRSGTSWHVHLTEEPGWTDVSFDDAQWSNADDFGGYGVAPWKKNILNFPRTSSAHWIWDEQEPSTLYLRGSFHFGPPQITSISPGSGLVGSEVSITGVNLAPTGRSSLPNTIKVMPLGNSLTRGVTGSTDNAGYRNDLAELLDGAGISYDFVGSLQNGTGFDNDHEGHSGFWADEVLADIDVWMRQNPPDMILFHIGTNDISSEQSNTSTIDEIGQNLDVIRNFDADIITLLAGIIPRKGSKDATTTALVERIKDLVTQRQAAGENVFYAGMNEAFKANPDWKNEYFPASDNVHPNDIGYAVMAGVWSDAITTVLTGAGGVTVEFNGVAATKVFVDSDSQIRATVPPGATTGRITVTNGLGTAVSPADFTVLTTTVAALEFSNPGPTVDWAPGSTHTLTWKTLGEVDYVKLQYSTDGGSIWQTLHDRVENTGKVAWTTPAVPFSHLMVRIADADNQRHGVNEMTIKVAAPAVQTEFPNAFEVRRALFDLKAGNTEALSRSDLDNNGRVDLVDYLNLLDLDNPGLRALKAGEGHNGTPASTGTLEVSIPAVTPVAGGVDIPVLLAGDQPIRGFQIQLEFDESRLDLTGALPYRNDFGMRLEGVISGNTLQVIGYLEKENSAVEINGDLFSLCGKLIDAADGDVTVRLVESLFVSKERLPITNASISAAGTARIPTEFALLQNYPNPFNPSTQITFHLPQRAKVEIKIYNLKGELVRTLVNEEREPGRHKIIWNGRNGAGVPVASGLYLYRIKAGKWKDTMRMMLVK
ncbi:MAG: tandem-95 repeat protein, partial [bacterium]